MFNTKFKIASVIFSLVMIVSLVGIPYSVSANESLELQYFERETNSNDTYVAINSIVKNDNHGGMYIDDDGNLNVYLVDGKMANMRNTVIDKQLNNQKIIYRHSKYSFSYLEYVQEKLMSLNDTFMISLVEINEFDNRITVGVLKNDKQLEKYILEKLKEILNLNEIDFIDFTPIIDEVEENATYTLLNGSRVSNYSICIGASTMHNGQIVYGFLTAGHCINVGGTASYNGKTLGTCIKSNNSGISDVAFIQRRTSPDTFKATTQLRHVNYGWTRGTPDFIKGGQATGTIVTLHGGYSSSTTSGKIKSRSVSFTRGGVKFNKFVSATYQGIAGDSGGAIVQSSVLNGLRYTTVCGIHSGSYTTIFGNKYEVYTDIDNAKNTIGFVGHAD